MKWEWADVWPFVALGVAYFAFGLVLGLVIGSR